MERASEARLWETGDGDKKWTGQAEGELVVADRQSLQAAIGLLSLTTGTSCNLIISSLLTGQNEAANLGGGKLLLLLAERQFRIAFVGSHCKKLKREDARSMLSRGQGGALSRLYGELPINRLE